MKSPRLLLLLLLLLGVRSDLKVGNSTCSCFHCSGNGCTLHEDLGFRVDFYFISIGSSGSNVMKLDPGEKSYLWLVGEVVDEHSSSCDTCITQFYVRSDSLGFVKCLGSSTDGWSFAKKVSFTAPTDAGIYDIDITESWQYSCENENSDTGPVIARVIVDKFFTPCSDDCPGICAAVPQSTAFPVEDKVAYGFLIAAACLPGIILFVGARCLGDRFRHYLQMINRNPGPCGPRVSLWSALLFVTIAFSLLARSHVEWCNTALMVSAYCFLGLTALTTIAHIGLAHQAGALRGPGEEDEGPEREDAAQPAQVPEASQVEMQVIVPQSSVAILDTAVDPNDSITGASLNSGSGKSLVDQLMDLKEAKDQGLLTDEEYAQARADLTSAFVNRHL